MVGISAFLCRFRTPLNNFPASLSACYGIPIPLLYFNYSSLIVPSLAVRSSFHAMQSSTLRPPLAHPVPHPSPFFASFANPGQAFFDSNENRGPCKRVQRAVMSLFGINGPLPSGFFLRRAAAVFLLLVTASIALRLHATTGHLAATQDLAQRRAEADTAHAKFKCV